MTHVLIADIGGTNARFALASNSKDHFAEMQRIDCNKFETSESAINHYLESQNIDRLDGICMAVAGPVIDQTAQFTNNHWKVDGARLISEYGTKSVRILNDFEAIAYSLPALGAEELISIGGDWNLARDGDFSVGVVGPGTGLGVAGLCGQNGHYSPVVAEGGHSGFSPENLNQVKLLTALLSKFDRVSNERLLSGPGIENIYQALAQLSNVEPENYNAAQIAAKGVSGEDELCSNTMDLFFEVLGQVAGDLALTLGSHDGIFIAGGICQRYIEPLQASRFRQGFANKGRHSPLLEKIPTWLITHPNPGLVGASSYARLHLLR